MADNDFILLRSIVERQQSDLLVNPDLAVEARKKRLLLLKSLLVEHESAFMDALFSDMGRPAFEAYSFEIAVLLNEIDYVCKLLGKWIRPVRSRHLKFGYVERIQTHRNPYGSVLIIGSWNYPLQLALMPAISAIAGGNRCVIKPSEHAPAVSKLLKETISKVFLPEHLAVVTGDKHTAQLLTSLPFDLIFFTGSLETGKAIAQQAALQLTPIILELGGKSPCIMDETGFTKAAIQEIVWGKYLNAGQTCIAPDTLFVDASIYDKVLSEISATLATFYGEMPEKSSDYGRICNKAHFDKLVDFINQGKVQHGGGHDAQKLFIEPTVLTGIKLGSSILDEEIFGPILPVIPYTNFQSLLSESVIQRDALTSYIFSHNKTQIQLLKQYMRSATLSVNQVIHHAANPQVAFGGVGRSGYGSYHGKAGFLACTYDKTDYTAYHYLHVKDKFPPYTDKNMNIVKKFRKWLV